ncbi:spermidine/putrescine ABC transporter substrate-binding protein [Aurantimonas sp. Leaf443]|uniref:polyamine ABC transporter substrate-binding protein n=1 Tax=Aurantimonas sp. Leaf443 TaxID=1736378 RepID=UPI0006FE2B45|nr:spermidine/putrescine ABC transporter substrate-binding protein [Aurantimonas sp. Leaf443]KQT85886.1 spermidine/putrescine ABC transporter substrate-binding protein [Aurantimonas sp. Leaf443]
MSARPLFFAALMALCTGSARAETLNLLIWESYIDPKVIEDWTARTGVEVHQINYDSGDGRDEILADPNSDVDLVVIGENSARLFGRRGILETVDEARTPAAGEYAPDWRARCAGFGLPYLWGTMGILYRDTPGMETPRSWSDLLEPAPALKGAVAMFDDHNETFVAPLVMLGRSVSTSDKAVLAEAFEVLKRQAPSVLTYSYVVTASQDPVIGPKIRMALGYSGDQHVLNARAGSPGDWRYVVPQEGTLSWLDCLSVRAGSPRKALALDLFQHLSSAPSALANARALGMPTANQVALAQLPDDIRNDPAVYPPDDVLARSQTQEELSADSVQTRRRIISALANFQ